MEQLQLSYSAEKKALACEQQYVFQKVLKVPPDSDANTDTLALRFGTAMHSILEWSQHELAYFEDKHEEYLNRALQENNLPDDRILKYCLAATVYSSSLLWSKTGLRVIKCELKIETEDMVGYIDLIAVDPNNGDWWIGDIKTASSMFRADAHRLRRDPQLCLYASQAAQVATALNLEVSRFKGCLYRETLKPFSKAYYPSTDLFKPELVIAAKEPILAYAKRVMATSYIHVIPVEHLSYEPVTVHGIMRDRILELRAGKTPIRNYGECTAYGKCCDYWSQCYGKSATSCKLEAAELSMCVSRVKGKGTKDEGAVRDSSYSLQSNEEQLITQPATEFDDSMLLI